MKIHPITLAFSGPSRHLESPFLNDYKRNSLRQVRIAILMATVFYALYGILDFIVAPDYIILFWILRWAVVCPLLLALLRFTYSDHYLRFAHPALGLVTLVAGFGLVVMSVLVPADQRITYLAGLVQVQICVYTVLRMRFVLASTIITLLFAVYVMAALISGQLPVNQFVSDALFLLGIHLMGMLACYLMEYYARKNFYLARQLESKKRRLDIANRYLEKRVDKRTAELTQANQRLEIEIKERKITEKKLRESKIRYGRMVNNVTDFICVHDLEGRILEVNTRMVAGLGYSYQELTATNLQDLIVAEQRSGFDRYLKHLIQRKRLTGTVTMQTKQGHQRLLTYSNVLVQDTAERDVVYCLARDITDHHRTVRALEESQACFKNIFETAAAGMMIIDGQFYKVVEINAAAAAMIGEPAQRIKGRRIDALILAAEGDTPKAHMQLVDPMECKLVSSSTGGYLPILKTMRPIAIDGMPHWIVSFVDIQKIKEAEKSKRTMEIQLQRAQHLQAIGTLAGGIAHDFNNILHGIMGYTQLAMDDAPQGSNLREHLSAIFNGSHRARELIAQILAYSRQDGAEKKPINPKLFVAEALKLLRASIPATVDIRTDFDPQISMVHGNATQVHQVVMNICTNAAHALKDKGGYIRIELKQVTVDTEQRHLLGHLRRGEYIRLAIDDNGPGMPPDVLGRIFEPFYTTKSQGEGSGMGLSVVLGIVQSHNGALRVHSAPGQGARFEVFLPALITHAQTDIVHPAQLPTGTERVLFVDDEGAINRLANQTLAKIGYKVTVCENGREALALFRKHPDDFDLVITDMAMPHITGVELAREIKALRPGRPVILCTGNSSQLTSAEINAVGICEVLSKPILKEELAAAIRRALESN